MESNTSEAASSSGNLASCSTDMYQSHQLQSSQQSQNSPVVQDFKMPSSLGEVQRIIGLSLSKIQMGRNQRGGLPLHKNLLVATVLNKARDLYMQETMYMNYKMMTGQFAAAASAASSSSGGSNNSQMHEAMHHHSQHYHHHMEWWAVLATTLTQKQTTTWSPMSRPMKLITTKTVNRMLKTNVM